MKMNSIEATKIISSVWKILHRHHRYSKYLQLPHEWGERAFRGWLIYEIFCLLLAWPIENVVFGEQFDVLLVDNEVKPRVYVETKRPGIGLVGINHFKQRVEIYKTLRYGVLSDGYQWLRYDIFTEQTIQRDIRKENNWEDFFHPLHAKNFIYGV